LRYTETMYLVERVQWMPSVPNVAVNSPADELVGLAVDDCLLPGLECDAAVVLQSRAVLG
jgi:hypothetical protein